MEIVKGYKRTEVGLIPEEWKIHKVKDLIDLLTDYDANGSFESVAQNVNVYDHEEYAWYVRSTDLENNSKLDKVRYVDESSYKFLKKTSLNGGENGDNVEYTDVPVTVTVLFPVVSFIYPVGENTFNRNCVPVFKV